MLLPTNGGKCLTCGNSRLKEINNDTPLIFNLSNGFQLPHVELGEISKRDYVCNGEKAPFAELYDQVSAVGLLPAQEHNEIGKLVPDRVNGRPGIPKLGSSEKGRIEQRQTVLIMEHWNSLSFTKHMN